MKTLLKLMLCFIPGFILVTGSMAQTVTTKFNASLNLGTRNQDSLPKGVSRDWLNSLTNENGQRIIPEDPEGDALQRKVFNGLGPNSNHGYSVASAGDVNGDEFDDIIVGAYGYNSFTGRVYIYFGGLNMNTVADLIITGESVNSYFGASVSTAGDVNGDGYSDVIVGAQAYNSNTGRAYVYLGGPSMNNAADVILTSEGLTNYFGISVSSAGDVSGDGYSDVIVGAMGYSSNTGRAYIYFGGASMNDIADVTMTGEITGSSFGVSVSTAGDVDGDGYSDVIVGANSYSSNTGRAYIYFGGAQMNNAADVTMTGEATNYFFGISVSIAGDVNGDGYSDVIVGAYGYNSNTGTSYIYLGGALMNTVADVTIKGEAINSYFGYSGSTAGDVNGDGYSDVIVGAFGYNSSTGRAYIFFGGTSMNIEADIIVTGEGTNNNFGVSVSSAGDVNGDGYSDMIAGAHGYSSNSGRVYLYDYYMRNEIIQNLSMTGEASSNHFGASVSSAGDVNGDGYRDIVVGAENYSTSTGRAYIFYGGLFMDNIADVTMTGEATGNWFGNSVSSAGDVNGDGYDDIIIAAKLYSSNTGRAYIYLGGASMNNIADVIITGGGVNYYFGTSLSQAGDVNGDGYSDVIVGAEGFNSYTGRAYIYYGGISMNNISDEIFQGEAINHYFGHSVSSTGDVNGDGYSDVIVGAYRYNSDIGRAYIYFGGSSMDNDADVVMNGEALSYFGYSVSGAGDVNGDGYSDVIAGAFAHNSFIGKAYIFMGGLIMNNSADLTMSGEAVDDYFGVSVSSGGDINGDGYSDIICGASDYGSYMGRVYIYLGGSSMNSNADVIMTGEEFDQLGYSVSSAGDVNGDGYSDLIIGGDGYNGSQGRANIYTGSAISAKPILNFVKDVPDDQGGNVNLKWARSSLDVSGNNLITSYSVYRSYPPSGGNFSWEEVASVTAVHHSFYTFTSPTPYDSGSNNSGNLFYKVRAKTLNVNSFWETAILSGKSIDNIAPLMVSPFTAAAEASNVRLNWNRSSAPDLLNYILYRSTSPSIDPYTEIPFSTSVDSTLLDTSPLSGLYYYFIVAQDIHANYSPVAVIQSPNIILNLTIFIEGFYNPGSNSQVGDTIMVQLRKSISPYAVADQSTGAVAVEGNVQLKFANAPDGNYFLAMKHRNSIETWSANPLALSQSTPLNYNLSSLASQAFGDNIKQVDTSPVRFGIYSGDVNQDDAVELSDIIAVYNDANNFVAGYVVTDVTGDNFVDLSDLTLAFNNSNAFVAAVTP